VKKRGTKKAACAAATEVATALIRIGASRFHEKQEPPEERDEPFCLSETPAGTLMRHAFFLPTVAALAAGVVSSPERTLLVASRGAPAGLTPRDVGAETGAVAVAAIAAPADHDKAATARTKEEAMGEPESCDSRHVRVDRLCYSGDTGPRLANRS